MLTQDSYWAFGWNSTVSHFWACPWKLLYPSVFIWEDISHFDEIELSIFKCKIHF